MDGSMTHEEYDQFRRILKELNRSQSNIREAMMFCIKRGEHSGQLSKIILSTLRSSSSTLDRKVIFWTVLSLPRFRRPLQIACLYLISDILHNTFSTKTSAWMFRSAFEEALPDVLEHLRKGEL